MQALYSPSTKGSLKKSKNSGRGKNPPRRETALPSPENRGRLLKSAVGTETYPCHSCLCRVKIQGGVL